MPGSWSKGSPLALPIVTSPLGAAGEIAIRSLIERAPLASSLAAAYKSAGFKLALVGGPVRDDANPFFEADNHGTAVAGIAAARGNNGLGVCGVAPEAQLVGLRLLGGARNGVGVFLDDLDVAESFSYLAQSGSATIDIKNNSWGPVDERFVLEAPGPLAAAALRWSAVHGRDGRGTVFVFASGNGRESGEDANLNGPSDWSAHLDDYLYHGKS